MVLKTFVISDL